MTSASLRERIREGAGDGLFFAYGYSAYAAVLFLFRGPQIFAEYGVAMIGIIPCYFVGGVTAGAICGALAPLTGTLLGRIVVGIVAALPFSSLLGLTVLPAEDIATNWWFVSVLCAVIWGVMGGTMFWFTRDR